jgi:hypothetical protein
MKFKCKCGSCEYTFWKTYTSEPVTVDPESIKDDIDIPETFMVNAECRQCGEFWMSVISVGCLQERMFNEGVLYD